MTVSLASAIVAFLPFRRAMRFGAVPLGNARVDVDECVWAVEVVASRLPWRAVCIEQGLAAQRMLRRGGIDALLHYGARHGAEGILEAHVWVSVDGRAAIGGEGSHLFAEVAVYP